MDDVETQFFILLSGWASYDIQIIEYLREIETGCVTTTPDHSIWCARVDARILGSTRTSLEDQLSALKSQGAISAVPLDHLKTYSRSLRRPVIPKIFVPKSPDDLRPIENQLYADTFKGTMEWIATYGYRLPVRELTRFFAKTTITPNMITVAALCCSFGAIPVFFFGWLKAGLALAASFIVLDSLDGKLARMTIRFSHAADRWDHLTSHPTRMAWYLGLGWQLSAQDFTGPLGIAMLVYTAMPLIDKLTLVAFNAKFGRSPLDYTPLDSKVHLFTVRRNDIFLMLFSSLFGVLADVYLVCTAWAVATWLWHLIRFIRFSISPLEKESAVAALDRLPN